MLVPHEPDLDPRVEWVLGLCRDVARTDVLAATWNSTKPVVEYDGVVSIERIDYARNASRLTRAIAAASSRLDGLGPTRRFAARNGAPPVAATARELADYHLGALLRLVSAWAFYGLLISALYRRGRALNVPPTVIISHDIYALLPATLLKRRFGSRLLHDSHEYFPEADLLAPRWQMRLARLFERRFIRQADRVVTVSPPLARLFEKAYGLPHVDAVPNAEPRVTLPSRSKGNLPRRFLLQGQASPGRGFEQLFSLWRHVDEPRAVLQVRCPDSAYVQHLRDRFATLFASGRAEWLEPVPGQDLVAAAAQADVGVIPYVGPSLNHLYACPNKLSQYMAAGLAVLACADMQYVTRVISDFDCGVTYDPDDPESLRRALAVLLDEPARLEAFQANAQHAAAESFNWEQVSKPYRSALVSLLR
jgi:glycosyltransferase involved in cell wall biosynthesis